MSSMMTQFAIPPLPLVALQTVTDDLGKGLGPALVAVVINMVGRRSAFNIATLG